MKSTTSISIDPDLLSKAKDHHINVSAAAEEMIRRKLKLDLNHIPQTSLRFECMECGKIRPLAYYCELRDYVYCPECHLDCGAFRLNGHEHKRIPDFNGEIPEKINKKNNE